MGRDRRPSRQEATQLVRQAQLVRIQLQVHAQRDRVEVKSAPMVDRDVVQNLNSSTCGEGKILSEFCCGFATSTNRDHIFKDAKESSR